MTVEHARAAVAGDADRIVELARALVAELAPMRGGGIWAVRDARPEPLADAVAGLLARDDAAVVVGTLDDTVVGFGVAELEALRDGRRLGRITELFVEPGARAVGVGEEIADRLVAWCRDRGCTGIDALALPGHRAAKNFFEESGFSARALVMHRALDLAEGP